MNPIDVKEADRDRWMTLDKKRMIADKKNKAKLKADLAAKKREIARLQKQAEALKERLDYTERWDEVFDGELLRVDPSSSIYSTKENPIGWVNVGVVGYHRGAQVYLNAHTRDCYHVRLTRYHTFGSNKEETIMKKMTLEEALQLAKEFCASGTTSEHVLKALAKVGRK